MKTVLIIGMGRFGQHLTRKMLELKNEVMIVDQREEALEALLPLVTSAKIGDCTNEEVLHSLGVGNFDLCFVCIGTNFQSSLEITSLLKEAGARFVVSKATRDIQAKFLLKTARTKWCTRSVISRKEWPSAILLIMYLIISSWMRTIPSMKSLP